MLNRHLYLDIRPRIRRRLCCDELPTERKQCGAASCGQNGKVLDGVRAIYFHGQRSRRITGERCTVPDSVGLWAHLKRGPDCQTRQLPIMAALRLTWMKAGISARDNRISKHIQTTQFLCTIRPPRTRLSTNWMGGGGPAT